MSITYIEKPTNKQKLHAIANACYDVKNGVDGAEKTIKRILEVLDGTRGVCRYSRAKGDYYISRG